MYDTGGMIKARGKPSDKASEGANGPSGLRERKKAQTREAIIDAALDLFERNGYEATTIEDIAGEANISPRTFFRYFDTKLEVILAESDAEAEGFHHMVEARPASEGALEALHNVMREQIEQLLLTDSRTAREMRIVLATPTLRSQALEHLREHQNSLVPPLAKRLGLDSDALRAHVLAGAATTMIWTVIEQWVARGSDPDQLLPMVDEGFSLLAGELD